MESNPAAKRLKSGRRSRPERERGWQAGQERRGGDETGVGGCQGHPGVGGAGRLLPRVRQVSPGSSRCGFDLWA